MARGSKDGKDRGRGAGCLPNREVFERMNFLLQSAQFYASLPTTTTTPAAVATGATAKGKEPDEPLALDNDSSDSSSSGAPPQAPATMLPLARFYAKEMRLVSRKSVLRMSPHIKRSICKVCLTPLVPGISSTTRVKGQKRSRRVITTCNYCQAQTRLFVNDDHVLFVDRPEHGTIS
ncbi:Ribonuclease P protein subunit p21 [Coemansia spiralis]|uniref:Ribonuclease P protein subunit p21 n=1 Tax=Coemansia spiralis TaxID=417178 RepID=A0A9W8GLL7_9FUNG|nr:Ribonuclease P protein subunit p21 [Coemansia spiralis]